MRLNRLGQAIGRGHIDGLVLPFPSWVGGYTEFCWLNDTTPIAQLSGATQNEIATFQAGAWTAVSPTGANWLRAGKGRWFAFPDGTDFAPADADPYIGTAVLTRYSSGSDVILVELNGTKATIPTGPLGTDAIGFRNARQRNGWLLYQAAGVWTLVALDGEVIAITPRTQYVDYAVPVSMPDGAVVLLERANGRLTLRYPNTTMGWVVFKDSSPTGLVVPDAIELNGLVRVVWSNDQSESAATFARLDILLDDSTRIDLNAEALPPVESVPLLGRPFGLAVYCFNNHTTVGNIQLPIRPTEDAAPIGWEAPAIATIHDEGNVGDLDLFAIYGPVEVIDECRAVGLRRARGLAIYQDSYPMRQSVLNLVTAHDLATPQLYRQAGETTPEFDARMKTECLRVAAEIPDGAECWPTVNIHRRYNELGPTLSVLEVVEGFVAATNRAHADAWPGMVLFRSGTTDVPDEIYPYIARFLSGITATPEARIIPEDPDMATAYVLLKKPDAAKDPLVTVTRVEEVQDGGKLFLKKPDDGDKMVCVNPDLGIEERPPNTHGAWEEFVKTAKGDYAAVRGNKTGVIVAV